MWQMDFQVEPYNARFGCLAINHWESGQWVVVAPNGKVLSKHGADVVGARDKALYINATATPEEQREWAAR
jgi:hypothetical protein